MGGGLRAAVLDAISLSPVAPASPATNSKNGQNATIRVTSELARSEDPFVRCAGCGVGQGCGAPVHARAPRNQLSSEKHLWFGRLFFVFLPDGAKCLIFTMNYRPRGDQVFTILSPNWPTPLLAPGPPKGDPGRSQESPGRVWRDSLRLLGEPIYRKTPDQPPLAAVMLDI